MATLVLQTAGAAIGSLFGPLGSIVGRAVGALAGSAIDNALFGGDNEGRRLADLSVQASTEGAAIPRVYGRARISGQIIWATDYEEEADGGKGFGGASGDYSYYGNFAVGLCEGPIARVGRIWADGRLLDPSGIIYRVHTGTGTQEPDSLIEAKQGTGEAPAYRGLAYVVFERLPLGEFGNRLPQLSFEVVRPVPGLEDQVRAITLIPGATEFGYDPDLVSEVLGAGARDSVNRHVTTGATDWEASLDELQALCPNLENVALVVTWFGDDLRAGHCALMPGVTEAERTTLPESWSAGGLGRSEARLISRHDGHAAYGGTPDDASVVRAIQDLKARGLRVTLYPFIMMDVPADNGLPDPYGGAEQGAYPWRGMITASVAPGQPGSPDKTAAAADQVEAFVGTAEPGDFAIAGEAIAYSGPAEWSYRRLVLHYAQLCEAAGGVDAFLIGSEMRGLTTLRSSASGYPFVDALVALAEDVAGVLRPGTELSYAADWSEYFGHQPADGSGDVRFHLDPLWADPAITFVGIDNYLPAADWRDGEAHLDAAQWQTGREPGYLRGNIVGGEYFDWYYASDADRLAQQRTAITDGAAGKPWVFRPKDLVGWWSNLHYDRPGGVEAGTPTAWQPQSKPLRFTELGCPAVDKGANQPNLFPDAKSSASGLPHFSTGVRDDWLQRRFLATVLAYWDPSDADFDPAANPVSATYGGRMVDAAAIHLWTWDTRPFPAFPYRDDIWADGPNWETGHWLTGRLGALATDRLVAAILADYGFTAAEIGDLDGGIDGYVIDRVTSARRALEPLADLLAFDAAEGGAAIRFVPRRGRRQASFDLAAVASEEGRPDLTVRRAQETELPAEATVGFSDLLADYRPATVRSRRMPTASRRIAVEDTAAVLHHAAAVGLAERRLQEIWAAREMLSLALPPSALAIETGDFIDIDLGSSSRTIQITRIEDAGLRRIDGRPIAAEARSAAPAPALPRRPQMAPAAAPPDVMLLDLPVMGEPDRPHAPRVAAFADPWPGPLSVQIGTADGGFRARQTIDHRAVAGTLAGPLWPGPTQRWDRVNTVDVVLGAGSLAGRPDEAVLNGSNLAAIGSEDAGWEVIQYAAADLVAPRTWRLSRLLRGQAGTEDGAAAGHPAGARFVALPAGGTALAIAESEAPLALTIRCGPAGRAYDANRFSDRPLIQSLRGRTCLAPVRLRGRRDGGSGDWALSWIRRTRLGDTWEAEVPLGEEAERYLLETLDGSEVLRSVELTEPAFAYTAGMQTADFGALQWEFRIRVRQISTVTGPGIAAEALVWNY